MAMNHNLSQGLSPSAGSYISLGNSGRSARVTGRRGSPLPRWATASAASRARHAEALRPGREDVPRVAPVEVPPAAPLATRSRHETTSATTMASLTIGPRNVDSHNAARPTLHRWRRRSHLYRWHTQASSYLQWHRPQRLLHLDELRAHSLLADGSSNDKTDGWCRVISSGIGRSDSSILMSREHTPSSPTAPATTRLTGGASTPTPPIT
jgi:hypothetical protein